MKSGSVRSRFSIGLLILFVFVFASVVWAEDVGTRLRCTVTDQTKAFVAHAQLTLKSSNNTFSATGASNDQGEYTFINVPPGTYQLTIAKDGFAPETFDNVTLDLNEVRVLNVALTVKAVSETLEISSHGESLSVVPQQTFLQGMVDPLRMSELPLNGRNFADLIYTQPGVVRNTSGSIGTGQSVDGARTSNNNFLVDDSDTNDPRIPLLPGLNINTSGIPLDAVNEFSVITTNATAEHGRSSGAIVNLATRSGTEKMHGSFWEFFRNDVLDAKGFFAANGQKEPFKQNQFGGRLGGAFKKTFYSGAYEGFRQRELVPTNALVPTPDFLASVVNPAWKALLQGLYPAPNQPVTAGAVVGIFNTGFDNRRDQDSGFLRVDRSFGLHQTSASVAGIGGDLTLKGDGIPGTGQDVNARNWHGELSDKWMFRPNVFNIFEFGVTRVLADSVGGSQSAAALQSGIARSSGPFAGTPFSSAQNSANGLPYVVTSTGLFSVAGPFAYFPQIRADNTFHVQDSVAWIRGKHQFTAGAEMRRIQSNDNAENFIRPTMAVDSSNLANLQAGLVLSQIQNFYTYNNTGERGFRNWEIGFFVADSYRALPRLTLDYGLRYELNLPMTEANNVLSNAFVMQNGRPMRCQSLPFGTGMQNVAVIEPSKFGIDPYCTDKNNFAPRVGLAWDMFGDGKTVLRGGYGIFYDRIYGFALDQFRTNAPFAASTRLGFFGYDGRQASSTVDSTSVFSVNSVDPGLRTPYVQRWHLTVSRQLSNDMLLNVSYAGARGSALAQTERPNFGDNFADAFRPSNGADPLSMPRNAADITNNVIAGPFGAFTNLTTSGFSRYDALQVELLKRYAKGFTFQASYTWSHSLDSTSDPMGAGADSNIPAATLNNLLAPLFVPGSSCPGAASPALPNFLLSAVRCATGNNALTLDQAAAIFVNQYISAADPRNNYGDSAFDARHRFAANAIYELPFGHNKRFFSGVRGMADKFISGWQVATILEAQAGTPLAIYSGADANFDGDTNDRAVATGNLSNLNYAGGSVEVDSNGSARQYQCTFLTTPSGPVCVSPVGLGLGVIDPRQRLGRGALRGPGLFNMDGSVSKRFQIKEGYSLQFRSEFFNLLNRTNFASPIQQINNPNFGISNSQLLINNTQSRQVQFGLKLEF